MRKPIIAGNWKMNKTVKEAVTFLNEVKDKVPDSGVESAVCGSFVTLPDLVKDARNTGVGIGAQNVHWEENGAFTGEVSPGMLKDLGVDYVIIGHSERRAYFNETDETVNKKVHAALAHGLKPIVCVGEGLEEREADKTKEVVQRQTTAAIEGLDSSQVERLVIAYEPIWAIGTGKSSTAEDANQVCGDIRSTLADRLDSSTAQAVRIQYGGSVKPENIDGFMAQSDIDGALVGGASLKPDTFLPLIDAAKRSVES